MSDHNGDQNEDVTNPDNVVDLEQASEHQGAQENASAANDTQAMLAKLEAENSELKDRLLRAAAEMENLRKRTQREAKDARTYAIADFARDMLSATDNLERALMTMTPEKRDAADPDTKSLIEGIEMTEREMQRLMQKNGVKPILAEGEKFNPHKHQAMFEVPDASVPEGTIVNVMQSGFEIGERVLRPAMVGVAKGGPKAAKPAVEPAPAQNADVSDSAAAENVEQTGHVDKEV